jgi:HNH endonuclease
MIPIRHPNLEQIAETHYRAIANYLKNDKLAKINQKIQSFFGLSYDFEKIVLAKPVELKNLAVDSHKNKSIFEKSYYGYLSSDTFYLTENQYYRGTNIIESLGIQVCPYCNRNFIYNLKNKRATYQLDHFYPQSDYPFLALSFYNLIPSCPTCNGLMQKKEKTVKVNPYDQGFPFDKIRFELVILKPDFYYNPESFRIRFDLSRLNTEQKADFQTNLAVFDLEKHYEKHKNYILRLIQKNITYSEAYLKELQENFNGTVFQNIEEVKGFVNENYDQNFHLRPLSKLTHDIAEELGLLG